MNELTRFESAVFKPMLEQMVWQGDGRGQVYIYGSTLLFITLYETMMMDETNILNITDPIECDCNLTWLIRDNRELLRATASGFCSNGTRFEELDAEGFEECDTLSNSPRQRINLQLFYFVLLLSLMLTLYSGRKYI